MNRFEDFRSGRYSQGIPDQRPGLVAGILIAIFLGLSILTWVFVYYVHTDTSIGSMRVLLVVSIASLLFNLFMIFRVGYNGFVMNFWVSYMLNVIFAVAGMFLIGLEIRLGDVNLIPGWRLLLYIGLSLMLSALPTFIISGIVWILMAMFGDM